MASEVRKRQHKLVVHYRKAKDWVESSPFVREVEWQHQTLAAGAISESGFLREYAWVVLNSGFRESVVRKHFDYISLSFCDWESAQAISENADVCVDCALSVFGHRKKLEAIVSTAKLISRSGFEWFRSSVEADSLAVLGALPYIGNVTKWHLAKNIGLDVAKPDRHLVRLAKRFGYTTVHNMCQEIFEQCGDRVAIADLILWRFEERSHSFRVG
jgi:hypothetical protein